MGTPEKKQKKILVLYYSHSSQSHNLIQAMIQGMADSSVTVNRYRLQPIEAQKFPIGTVPSTVWKMLRTFFRQRVPIELLPSYCFDPYDLVVLAGPTWSYHPSGPVLSLFDRDGDRLFEGSLVIPMISCRGYWRMHWWGLKLMLKKYKATIPNVIIFTHPNKEPWRTVGVFLKLAGQVPERMGWMQPHYRKFGHTRSQLDEARSFGEKIVGTLARDEDLAGLDFNTGPARHDKS